LYCVVPTFGNGVLRAVYAFFVPSISVLNSTFVIVSLPTTATALEGTLRGPLPPQPAATSTTVRSAIRGRKRRSLMWIPGLGWRGKAGTAAKSDASRCLAGFQDS